LKDRRKLLILAASVTILALAVLFAIGKATRQGANTSDPALREAPTPIEVVPAATLEDYLRECLTEKPIIEVPVQTSRRSKQ